MNCIPAVTGFILGVLLTSLPALAHHSEVMFDNYHPRVTITGLVQSFAWRNLHGRIALDVETVDARRVGQPELWVLEIDAPGKLTRQRWSHHTLNRGDKITLEIIPVRSAGRGGLAKELKRLNGIAFTGSPKQQYAAARQPPPE